MTLRETMRDGRWARRADDVHRGRGRRRNRVCGTRPMRQRLGPLLRSRTFCVGALWTDEARGAVIKAIAVSDENGSHDPVNVVGRRESLLTRPNPDDIATPKRSTRAILFSAHVPRPPSTHFPRRPRLPFIRHVDTRNVQLAVLSRARARSQWAWLAR